MQTRIVWVNKAHWKKPGPITYMGLLNAMSFAWIGYPCDFYIASDKSNDIDSDLALHYGLQPHPLLNITTVVSSQDAARSVYKKSLASIERYCKDGDNVLAITRELGLLPSLFKLRRRYPNLRVIHEVHDYYGSIKHLQSIKVSAVRRMLAERWLFKKLDGLLCLTEYQRALYQQWLPRVPMLVAPLGSAQPNPVSLPSCTDRRNRRSVAYIGHLHSYKGLAQIFQIAHRLKAHNINLHCYGGNQPQTTQLLKQAKQENLEGTLYFHPFVSPNALSNILKQDIAIGLVPLQDTFYSRYLTCPVKALDFLRFGIPIVGSDIPCVSDIIGDAGLLSSPTNIDGFCQNIVNLLQNDILFRLLSTQSLQRSQELSWTNRANTIIKFYQRELMPTQDNDVTHPITSSLNEAVQ